MSTSHRTTNVLLVLLLAVGVAIIAMLASGVRGGPLDPPLAPASTNGVRLPGTPIDAGPYTISASGHYYLTQNIVVPGAQIAITIAADNVSLDLGGFTVKGDDTAGSWGVRFSGARQNVTITNGTVSDFHFGFDIPTLSQDIVMRSVNAVSGIRGFSLVAVNLVLEDCTAFGNAETGIYIPGDQGVVRNCAVIDNQGDGISAGNDNLIERNKVTDNNLIDINATGGFNSIRENDAGSIAIGASRDVVSDNICRSLTGAGGSNITAATSHQNIGC